MSSTIRSYSCLDDFDIEAHVCYDTKEPFVAYDQCGKHFSTSVLPLPLLGLKTRTLVRAVIIRNSSVFVGCLELSYVVRTQGPSLSISILALPESHALFATLLDVILTAQSIRAEVVQAHDMIVMNNPQLHQALAKMGLLEIDNGTAFELSRSRVTHKRWRMKRQTPVDLDGSATTTTSTSSSEPCSPVSVVETVKPVSCCCIL